MFRWLPLATIIDSRVLVVHGGISDTTDLGFLASLQRHRVRRKLYLTSTSTLSKLIILQVTNKASKMEGRSMG